MPLYLVDTIQTFHVRYVIDAKNETDAMDEIIWEADSAKLEEFSQKYLGEVPFQPREITQEEFDRELEKLNQNLDPRVIASPWIGAERLINVIDYSTETEEEEETEE